MKLSWGQVKYTLYMNVVTFVSDLRLLPFTIKLKALAWWYGGGDKIPPKALGKLPLLPQDAAADNAMLRAVAVHQICKYINDYFNTPVDNRRVGTTWAHLIMGKIDDVELAKEIEEMGSAEDARLRVFEYMRAVDEITDVDLALARLKPDWNDFSNWLKVKIDKAGEPVQ